MAFDKEALAKEVAQKLLAEGAEHHDVDEVLDAVRRNFIEGKRDAVRAEIQQDLVEPDAREQETTSLEASEALMQEIIRDARSICGTSVSATMWARREPGYQGGSSGFKQVPDKRLRGIGGAFIEKSLPFASFALGLQGTSQLGWDKLFASQGVSTAVTVAPVKHDANGSWTVPLSKFTRNPSDTEPAYQLIYMVMGNEHQVYPDPTTKRSGNNFCGCVILTKKKAEQTLDEIRRNPRFAREIFRRMEPELLQEQEVSKMPADTNIAIIADPDSSFEWEEVRGRARKRKNVKRECIVQVPTA